jgi:hypothetical protein
MSTSKELLKVSLEGHEKEHKPDENINLNEMIRQALKPFKTPGKSIDIIVRCSDMPFIKGDPALVREVCNDLVKMIMLYPGSSKRFLHIKCEEQVPLSRKRQHVSNFIIEFHTNLSTDTNWKQLNQETVLTCQQKLQICGANLAVHEILTAGRLFSISLQGKIF